MLGELYKPKGLALETAKAVLEVEDPYAVNVAFGCSNACAYCYVPRFTRRTKDSCQKVRLPEKSPSDLVRHQLERLWPFHWKRGLGVFLSFLTDPFLPEVKDATEQLIEMLRFDYDIRVATLSKLGVSCFTGVRYGVTMVSLDCKFYKKFEPNALSPKARIALLKDPWGNCRGYSWVSMEPYPCSAIWKQDLTALLEALKFVKLIVFGKWNYDPRAKTEQARQEYAENIQVLRDFCKSNNIRHHVKSDTLQFAAPKVLWET